MALALTGSAAAIELQPDSYLDYVPSLGGNTALAVIYTLMALGFWWHTFMTGPKIDKWALCLPIATTFEALGFYLRIAMRTSQHNEPLYTVMYLFVVLSPAGFLAFNYILFGRLIAALEGSKPNDVRRKSRYSFIPPRWVKRIFVVSDVCTFCIQAAGGGLQTSTNIPSRQAGNKIFLAGVSGQGASYLLFTALTLYAHLQLVRDNKKRYSPFNLREPAVQLIDIMYLSSIGILVRSVYRIIEMAQGYGGNLYSHEIYTFTLDALPLVVAMSPYDIIWPNILLRPIRAQASQELEGKTEHRDASSPTSDDLEVQGPASIAHSDGSRAASR